MTERFPKYLKINFTEMIRLGEPSGNSARYFRPCGEWDGDLEFNEETRKYRFPYPTPNEPTLTEITPQEFLKANPYGYSNTTKHVFKQALKDIGLEPKVKVLDQITHELSYK